MKSLLPFVFIFSLLIPLRVTAQSPVTIEADLLKSFKKIDQSSSDNFEANEIFAKKLKMYAEKFPFTINQNFNALKAAHLDISTSSDDLLRIYSWDTWTGGTMHFFENVFQYKSGTKTFAVIDTPRNEGDSRPSYYKLYTFKTDKQSYYLSVYMFIESSRYYGEGIQVFSIEKDKLNDNVKLIKTSSGLHSQLTYEYDIGSIIDRKAWPKIYFETASNTIHIPLAATNGKLTHGYIVYKFTGEYFERVKN